MTRRVSSPDLVGRSEELTLLRGALDDAASGTPRLVLIDGEAGIGKTRLLSDFAVEAAERDVTVLRGACVDLGGSAVPHMPLQAALEELIGSVGVDRVLDLAGPGIVALAPLMPGLAERAPPEAVSGRADESQLFDVVARLLDRLSHDTAVLLAIEDLHWADGSTRGLLGYLARSMRASRVMVVVTARTDPPPPAHTTELLDELVRLPSVERMRLTRLGRDDVARQLRGILGRSAPAPTLSYVTRISQGVPFLVEELASADRPDQDSLPDTVRELVLVRVRSLGQRARRVLGSASIAAVALDEPALCEVADLPTAEVEVALRELVDSHLLVVDRATGRYEFRHALIREAVRTDLLAAESGRLHRRCAELLETRAELAGPSCRADAQIAHHWWWAGDEERAYASALIAADGARGVHSYEEEFALLQRALELWPRVQQPPSHDAPDLAELLWRAAKAADRFGELDAARELYQAARHELVVEEQLGRVADVLFDEVGLLAHVGDLPECEAATRRVLALLPAEPSLPRARALVALQAFHYQRREIDELRAVTQDAIVVADEVGAAALAGRARLTLIAARAADADENSYATQRAVRALAAEAGDTDLLLATYINESDGYLVDGCFAEAARLAREGQRLAAQRGGSLDHHDYLLMNLACALIASGDWTEAETILDDALLVDRPGALRANLHGFLAEVRLARGDLAGAEQAAADAHRRLEGLHADPQSYPPIASVRGEIALARGRAAEALDIVRRMYDEVGDSIAYPSVMWPALWVAARAIGALGQEGGSADAARWLVEAAACQSEHQVVPPWGSAAEAVLSGGDVERWRVAVAAVKEAPEPVLLRLRVLLAAARAEMAAGARAQARDLLERVLLDAERLGALLVLAEARDFARRSRLVVTNARTRRATFGLTDRELEVLRLLAAGMSNRAIGVELFLSPKTVSVHVSHILAKLGVTGRGEAAVAAFSHGLATPAPRAAPAPR